MAKQRLPIHRGAHRPNLFLGCDRELIMLSAMLSAILIFITQTLIAALLGIVIWVFALFVLRRMAKADPLMREVYRRQLGYQEYYPAKRPVTCRTHRKWRR